MRAQQVSDRMMEWGVSRNPQKGGKPLNRQTHHPRTSYRYWQAPALPAGMSMLSAPEGQLVFRLAGGLLETDFETGFAIHKHKLRIWRLRGCAASGGRI